MAKRIFTLWFSVILTITFLSGCTGLSRPNGEYKYKPQGDSPPDSRQINYQERSGSLAGVVQKASPSVVGISTIYENIFLTETETVEGVGSGFIVHQDGYILTNEHVVGSDAKRITVILHNGDQLKGRLMWSDPTLDLAVVKVNASNLPAVTMGNSEEMLVGDTAIAIGTPLGLQFQHTVTAGIISALNRTVQVPTDRGQNYMEDLIQTDASINPGNSGGPLMNINGEVIGINTVKVASAEGIGFAIPIDVARPIIERFVKEGEFTTPYIGIVGFDKEMASYYKKDGSIKEGVYIVNIDPKGPAYEGGIRVDDIITQIGDQKIRKMLDLRKAVYSYPVGSQVGVTVIRGNDTRKFTITLTEKKVGG